MKDILKDDVFDGASKNDEELVECAKKHLRNPLQSTKGEKVLNVWIPLDAWDKNLAQSTSQEEWQKEEILNKVFDEKNTRTPPYIQLETSTTIS